MDSSTTLGPSNSPIGATLKPKGCLNTSRFITAIQSSNPCTGRTGSDSRSPGICPSAMQDDGGHTHADACQIQSWKFAGSYSSGAGLFRGAFMAAYSLQHSAFLTLLICIFLPSLWLMSYRHATLHHILGLRSCRPCLSRHGWSTSSRLHYTKANRVTSPY